MVSPTRTKLSRAVATMIALDFQPMSIVEDAGFRQLVKALDPKYVLPTCHTLTKKILPQLLSEKVESLKTKLRQTNDVSLMTDAWTSTNNTPYLVITAHFFCENSSDKNISLAFSILTCSKIKESCTGEYLKEELISTCDKFLIKEKLIACITVGGQNMIKAVKEMKGAHLMLQSFAQPLCAACNRQHPGLQILEREGEQLCDKNEAEHNSQEGI